MISILQYPNEKKNVFLLWCVFRVSNFHNQTSSKLTCVSGLWTVMCAQSVKNDLCVRTLHCDVCSEHQRWSACRDFAPWCVLRASKMICMSGHCTVMCAQRVKVDMHVGTLHRDVCSERQRWSACRDFAPWCVLRASKMICMSELCTVMCAQSVKDDLHVGTLHRDLFSLRQRWSACRNFAPWCVLIASKMICMSELCTVICSHCVKDDLHVGTLHRDLFSLRQRWHACRNFAPWCVLRASYMLYIVRLWTVMCVQGVQVDLHAVEIKGISDIHITVSKLLPKTYFDHFELTCFRLVALHNNIDVVMCAVYLKKVLPQNFPVSFCWPF